MEQKIQKKFFVFQIIAFELGVANSHNLERDTCHQMFICSKTTLRFDLTLGETFCKLNSLGMRKKQDKSALMEISQVFQRAFTCSISRRVLKRRFLESGLTKIFTVCSFGNTVTMTIIFFFKIFKIWCRFKKRNEKFRKCLSFFR